MRLPLPATFHIADALPGVEEVIRERATTQLDRFCDHILWCWVVIDSPHR